MAGVVFRLQDERNFYVVRASALGNTFRRLRDGKKCAEVLLTALAAAPADAKPVPADSAKAKSKAKPLSKLDKVDWMSGCWAAETGKDAKQDLGKTTFVDLLGNTTTQLGLAGIVVLLGGLFGWSWLRKRKTVGDDRFKETGEGLQANSLFGATGGQSVDTGTSTFNSSFIPTSSNSARGDVNSISLRNLGAGNTLVLLNGRRVANYAFNGAAVDVNAIPLAAVVIRDNPKAEKDASGRVRTEEGVYTLNGNTVHFVPIKTGLAGELDIEVVLDRHAERQRMAVVIRRELHLEGLVLGDRRKAARLRQQLGTLLFIDERVHRLEAFEGILAIEDASFIELTIVGF